MGGGSAARGADLLTGLGFGLFLAWMGWTPSVFEPVAAEASKLCMGLAGASGGLLLDSVAESSLTTGAHPFPFCMGVGFIIFSSLFPFSPITFLNGVDSPSNSVTLSSKPLNVTTFHLGMFFVSPINHLFYRIRKRSKIAVCYGDIESTLRRRLV